MNRTKIKKITDLLDKLYCFEQTEIETFMKRIPYMKEEGLNELIKTLEDGLKEQGKMIQNWIRREPSFGKRLTDFVDQKANALQKEAEESEKTTAEDILTELNQ